MIHALIVLTNQNLVRQKFQCCQKRTLLNLSILEKNTNVLRHYLSQVNDQSKNIKKPKTWLKENGFSSTAEYLIHASEIALKGGLFPHTNAGNLTKDEMRELKKTNVAWV